MQLLMPGVNNQPSEYRNLAASKLEKWTEGYLGTFTDFTVSEAFPGRRTRISRFWEEFFHHSTDWAWQDGSWVSRQEISLALCLSYCITCTTWREMPWGPYQGLTDLVAGLAIIGSLIGLPLRLSPDCASRDLSSAIDKAQSGSREPWWANCWVFLGSRDKRWTDTVWVLDQYCLETSFSLCQLCITWVRFSQSLSRSGIKWYTLSSGLWDGWLESRTMK